MYTGYVVLQFEIKNLLPDIVIKDAVVSLQLNDSPLQAANEVKSGTISQGTHGYAYNVLTYNAENVVFPTATLKAKLSFNVFEIDPASKEEQGSYPDEYTLPDVVVSAKDYVRGTPYESKEFR